MKKTFIVIFLLTCGLIFSEEPVIIEKNGGKLVWELTTLERATKLKQLYETKYENALIMGENEFPVFSSDINNKIKTQLGEISEGNFKIASILITGGKSIFVGFVYYGYDYAFILLFSNTPDIEFINIWINQERYKKAFQNAWDLLLLK